MAEPLGVGLCGLGTVGTAVARLLLEDPGRLGERAGRPLQLRGVAVRDPERIRAVDLDPRLLTGNPLALAEDPAIDVVIEVMGGTDIAHRVVSRALQAGKSVVSANKALLATAGPELVRLAVEKGGGFGYEAAVGAGLPMVWLLTEQLRGDRVQRLQSVVNGTTNVILSQMAQGQTFSESLTQAQSAGLAETDPSLDVDGWDAVYKLSILARAAFGMEIDPQNILRQGIEFLETTDFTVAGKYGYSVKLLAEAAMVEDGISLSVWPTLLPAQHPLSHVDGLNNALVAESDLQGTVILQGVGAGGTSTASAVINDLIGIARGKRPYLPDSHPLPLRHDQVERGGYIRLGLRQSGDIDLLQQQVADRGIVVEESMVTAGSEAVLLTSAAPRAMHHNLLSTLDSLSYVTTNPIFLETLPHE